MREDLMNEMLSELIPFLVENILELILSEAKDNDLELMELSCVINSVGTSVLINMMKYIQEVLIKDCPENSETMYKIVSGTTQCIVESVIGAEEMIKHIKKKIGKDYYTIVTH